MTRPLLLVTGSRHFVTDGEEWCRNELVKILGYLPPNAVVLHGGAKGPDAWADEHARALGLATIVYHPGGRIEGRGIVPARDRWAEACDISRRSFLLRDQYMVAAARVYWLYGRGPVACVGFRHLGSKTHGTEYTLRLAREAGLWTEERVHL